MRNIILVFSVFVVTTSFAAAPFNHQTTLPEIKGTINQVITVGTDQACDFNNIQNAIDSVPDNSQDTVAIRVTNQQEWNVNLVITNKENLQLYGQWANCTDAMNNLPSGNRTTINNVDPTLAAIFLNNTSSTVIGSFEIKNGQNSGVIVSNGSHITLTVVSIHDINKNVGKGGGVLVVDSFLWISNSNIFNNQANHGGGIACENGVLSTYGTIIDGNQTNITEGKGGGVFVKNCNAKFHADPYGEELGLGITNNTAARYGGGIYAESGAYVGINTIQQSANVGQFMIAHNTISNSVTHLAGGGAGIYATGFATDVFAYATSIANNEIDNNLQFVGGAAIAIDDQATFNMLPRTNKVNCANIGSDDRSCNQIKNNTTKSGDAAVIKISGGAQAKIYNASIFGNQTLSTTNQLTSVINGDLTMQGVLVYDNGPVPNPPTVQFPTRLFRVSTLGTFHGDFMTIMDNRLWNGSVIQAYNSAQVNLTRSIVQTVNAETVYNDSGNPSTTLFKCLLTDENSSFNGFQITVDDPVFQPTIPYRLSPNSPGVNMCTHGIGDLLPEPDIDDEERGPCPGLCSPQRFDAGADEFTTTDLIFKNGFEIVL